MNMDTETLYPTPSTRNYPLTNYTVNPQISEKQFDEFTALIANLCEVPKALITLIDGDKLWFKSNLGMPVNYVDFKKSYCQFTVARKTLVEISNVETDSRLRSCKWSEGYPFIKFYAGVPLVNTAGEIIGTLCIMDSIPHVLSIRQKEILSSLGQMVCSLIESRKDNIMGIADRRKSMIHSPVSLRAMRSITRSW